MNRFLEAQRRAVDCAKWLEGVEIGHDPGNGFVINWIELFAKKFRDQWQNSCCKDCKKDCAYECRSFCDRYEKAE